MFLGQKGEIFCAVLNFNFCNAGCEQSFSNEPFPLFWLTKGSGLQYADLKGQKGSKASICS